MFALVFLWYPHCCWLGCMSGGSPASLAAVVGNMVLLKPNSALLSLVSLQTQMTQVYWGSVQLFMFHSNDQLYPSS